MKINFIISILFLFIIFLLYKKKDKKLSIVNSIIFNICLFFCYETVIVCLLSYFKLGGNVLYFSIINYVIGVILLIISIKRRKIQKYYLDKKSLLLIIAVLLTTLLLVLLRFDKFTSLSYATDDPAVHYKTSVMFSKNLYLLNEVNSKDIIHRYFKNSIPIFYVNCGMVFYLFSNISKYKLFMMFDSFCFILYSLLFLVTLLNISKKRNYLYLYAITVLYSLSYPLNNLIFGFCYLGLGVMVINLFIYFINEYKKELNKNIIYKLVILFILSFSMFFSYYLFMPPIYLSLGLYYIYLYKHRRIKFMELLIYGVITLIIPFIIGTIYFIVPSFIKSSKGIFGIIGIKGFIYNNATPIIVFNVIFDYLIYYYFWRSKKLSYFMINFYIFSIYVFMFLILYIFKISEQYYFYKLFYAYYLFAFIFLFVKCFNKRYYVYYLLVVSIIFLVIVSIFPYSMTSNALIKASIYGYNGQGFNKDGVIFNENEFKIVDKVPLYQKMCEVNNEFLIIGMGAKNIWFYEITGSVPIFNHVNYNKVQLYNPSVSLYWWDNLPNHNCVVYFYENNDINYDRNKYDILFENSAGAILKRKNTIE